MSKATVDSLELKISSNSKKATESIDALIASLDKLKKATQGIGLEGFSTQAKATSKSVKSMATATDTASKSTKNMAIANNAASTSYVNLAAKVATAY